MALSSVVSEIGALVVTLRTCYGALQIVVLLLLFNVEKCRDLEIGVRGHSRSLKVLLFDRLCMTSY